MARWVKGNASSRKSPIFDDLEHHTGFLNHCNNSKVDSVCKWDDRRCKRPTEWQSLNHKRPPLWDTLQQIDSIQYCEIR